MTARDLTKKDIIGHTIEDLAGNLNLNVKLGANSGSGFIFCGDISTIDTAELNYLVITGYRNTIRDNEAIVRRLKAMDKSREGFARAMRIKQKKTGRKYKLDDEAYNAWLTQINNDIKRANSARQRAKQKLAKFTPIDSREIVDVFKSILEPETVIMLYDGVETGRYWTTDEFKAGGSNG